jgi:hypothetical protein
LYNHNFPLRLNKLMDNTIFQRIKIKVIIKLILMFEGRNQNGNITDLLEKLEIIFRHTKLSIVGYPTPGINWFIPHSSIISYWD